MKSEKAKKFIECTFQSKQYQKDAAKAVELAEQEMQEKAIEAHINTCNLLQDDGTCSTYKLNCTENCLYVEEFINQLNNK